MPEVELTAGTIDYEDTGGEGPVLVLLGGGLDGRVGVGSGRRRPARAITAASCRPCPLGAHRQADAPRRRPLAERLRRGWSASCSSASTCAT